MEKGYFHFQLHAYLSVHHPDKLLLQTDEQLWGFIDLRAQEASVAFEDSRRSGGNVVTASEAANSILFAGLEFSPYGLLKDTIEESFPSYLPLLENREDKNFTGKLLEDFLPIIARLYDPEGNPTRDSAQQELTSELKQYLRKIFI